MEIQKRNQQSKENKMDEEKGTIIRQKDGDLYECLMEDSGRIYIIEIPGYSGGKVDVRFSLHRNDPDFGERLHIEGKGVFKRNCSK